MMAAIVAMVLAPAGLGGHVAVVMHAPYKGAVSPSSSIYLSGCGKVSMNKPFTFKLGTGVGGTASAGSAAACKHSLYGVGQSSDVSADSGTTILVPLKTPSGTTNVTASTSVSWTTILKAADGSKTGACTNGVTYSYYNYTDWEWNSFHNFAYTDSYYSGGQWYNYSYNTASIPSPFNLNNTTYYYHDSGFSYYASCFSEAEANMYMYMYLHNESAGPYGYLSGASAGSSLPGSYCYSYFCDSTLLSVFVELYNETDWGQSQYYEWDQGTSYGSNNTTAFSYNRSLEGFTEQYTPGSTSSSCGFTYFYVCTYNNTTNVMTFTNSSSLTAMTWFNGTFATGSHYALEVNIYVDMFAYQDWAHGSASWNTNMLTLGHGFHLTSISAT